MNHVQCEGFAGNGPDACLLRKSRLAFGLVEWLGGSGNGSGNGRRAGTRLQVQVKTRKYQTRRALVLAGLAQTSCPGGVSDHPRTILDVV